MKHATKCLVVSMFLLVHVSSAQWHQQSSGTTPRATNGGSHWKIVQTGVRQILTSMSSIDAVHGPVAASGGDIPSALALKTSHRGKLAIAEKAHTLDMFYLPDTVIAYSTGYTKRYTYTYDASGNMLTELWENWNVTQWVSDYRSSYTYDASGNMLTRLQEVWNVTQWVNASRSTYTYDAGGNRLTDLEERWDGTQWVSDYRSTYTYDAGGNRLTDLEERWDGTQWVSDYRSTSTYDANGNMLTELEERWDGTQWVNDYRSTCTYDANGNGLTELWEIWDGTQWVSDYRSTSTYDVSGNVLTYLWENWDGTQWVIGYRSTYTYDVSGNMLLWLREVWSGTHWVNAYRSTNTYDASGNRLMELREEWTGTQWVHIWRQTFTYDASGNISLFNAERWLGSTWVPADGYLTFSRGRNDYFFSGHQITLGYTETTTSIAAQQEGPATSYELAQNYPNPFNPSTTIRVELPRSSQVSLRVYNTLGQEVATLLDEEKSAGVFDVRFDAGHLASGVYVYRLKAGDFVQTRKLILLR